MARVGCMKVSQLKSRVQKLFRSNKYHHIYTQSMHVCSVAFICKANTGNTGEMLQNLMNYLTGKIQTTCIISILQRSRLILRDFQSHFNVLANLWQRLKNYSKTLANADIE